MMKLYTNSHGKVLYTMIKKGSSKKLSLISEDQLWTHTILTN